jgi:hypothetical protein
VILDEDAKTSPTSEGWISSAPNIPHDEILPTFIGEETQFPFMEFESTSVNVSVVS